MPERRLVTRVFLGGATGATGREVVALARGTRIEVRPHVRPRSVERYRVQQPEGPEPVVFDLTDRAALVAALRDCDAAIHAIGTMRSRFEQGDTYESSDVGAARALLEAAAEVGLGHFVLLGAAGTDWVPGPYYEAKRRAEALARERGLPLTIVRPSALVGQGRGSRALLLGGTLSRLPLIGGAADAVRGIPCEVVARAMLRIVADRSHLGEVVAGRELWALGTGPLS